MAMRREDGRRDGGHDQQAPEEDMAVQAEPKTIGQVRVRPEMIAVAQQVIVKRRRLLERLAAYDRGEDAGR